MRYISGDTETHPIKAGCGAPKLVCVTFASKAIFGIDEATGRSKATIHLPKEGLGLLRDILRDKDMTLVGQHIFYDLGVACAEDKTFFRDVFDAFDDGRIRCVRLRQQMIDNVTGELKFRFDEETGEWEKPRYGLENLVQHWFHRFLSKGKKGDETGPGRWRKRYNELDGVPLVDWPQDALDYAMGDAVETDDVHTAQENWIQRGWDTGKIPGEVEQTQAGWPLHLMSCWGVRTDGTAVAKYKIELQTQFDEAMRRAQLTAAEAEDIRERAAGHEQLDQIAEDYGIGLMKEDGTRDVEAIKVIVSGTRSYGLVRKDPVSKRTGEPVWDKKKGEWKRGAKDMKAIRAAVVDWYTAHDRPIKMTDGGKKGAPQVSTERGVLIATDDAGLKAVADTNRVGKNLQTYVPVLEGGTEVPINANYNTIIETYRTSCSGPNLQNMPRKGGVRLCYIPRVGWVYVNCDYDSLEMRTLAQVCIWLFGYSAIAEAIRKKLDLHVAMAADMIGLSYEEAYARYKAGDEEIKKLRQFAKIANYGMAGGMGPEAFVDYAKDQGCELHPDRVEALKMARSLHAGFRSHWIEMVDYFAHCSNACSDGRAEVQTFLPSGMLRGKVPYTAFCNGYFQSLAASGAKAAAYEVSREMYLGHTRAGVPSALYGSRAWLFAHDELGLEAPWYGAASWNPIRGHLAAMALQERMKAAMQEWVPDVPIGASVVMTRRWFKGAEPVFIETTQEMIEAYRRDPIGGGDVIEFPKKILVPCKPKTVIVVKDGEEVEKIVWEEDLYAAAA